MQLQVVTLFPEFFPGPLGTGLVGKALAAGRVEVGYVNPRDFTRDRHRSVDDTPYGGGAGMVMKPQPLLEALAVARSRAPGAPVLVMSPQGRRLAQRDLAAWARGPGLVLVAGRYEGFDERVLAHVDAEVSLGDFVLTGGEHAALVIIDGVVRLLPGTLGNEASAESDSFSAGLLEHPHYTRPLELDGVKVPDVLLGGHHEEIAAWRHARALERTRARRPDLLEERGCDDDERRVLIQQGSSFAEVRLAVGLGTPPTPGEVTAWARLAAAYQLAGVQLVLEAPDAVEAARRALAEAPLHAVRRVLGSAEARRLARQRRARWPTETLEPARCVEVADGWAEALRVEGPIRVGLMSTAPARGGPPVVGPQALAEAARVKGRPLLLCLGRGLHADAVAALLPRLRAGTEVADLPALAAAAIALDRLRGEA
jgi:tRNA (guanine37-N1)-methyltransferase